MNATLTDLMCCLALWVVPLAALGVTELVRRRRDLIGALHPGLNTRSDPSAEMWSAVMRHPRRADRGH
jgi:hypothetical protein